MKSCIFFCDHGPDIEDAEKQSPYNVPVRPFVFASVQIWGHTIFGADYYPILKTLKVHHRRLDTLVFLFYWVTDVKRNTNKWVHYGYNVLHCPISCYVQIITLHKKCCLHS